MQSVGVLILFAVLGAVICAKARVAGGAIVFSLIALVLFVSTPAGSRRCRRSCPASSRRSTARPRRR